MNDSMGIPPKPAFRVLFIFHWISVMTLTNAVTLDYSKSNLVSVPAAPEALIKGLNLKDNNIEELGPGSFVSYPELTDLDLSFNPLQVIHDGTFDTLSNLLKLTIIVAEIVKLPSDFGPSTRTLVDITLTEALINPDILTYPYFAAFSDLEFIYLAKNDIKPPNATILPQITQYINFDTLNISTFPHFSSYTPNVQSIYIQNNNISNIPQKGIDDLILLKKFLAKNNEIKQFPNFSHCGKLTDIIMNLNEIRNIPREHIIGLTSINDIDLSENVISVMPDISYLTTLEKFKIGFNHILEIPQQYLSGLLNMKIFDCQSNKISFLPDISRLFPSLQKLYVQGNYLKVLPDLYD